MIRPIINHLCILMFCSLMSTTQFAFGDSLSARQKLTIEQITSIFENGTTDFQYGYIEDIGDGAGITCGRVGFTGSELLLVISRYVAKKPASDLAQYIPCLQKMGDKIMSDYSCLYPSLSPAELATPEFKQEGGTIGKVDFGKAWRDAARGSVMRQIQDDYEEEAYFQPAIKLAAELGLTSVMGAAFVYDACIQMGCDSPLFKALPKQFAEQHHGQAKPQNPDEETAWLELYIPERKTELSTTPAGAATVDRVESLAQLLATKNYALELPLDFDYSGHHFEITDSKAKALLRAILPANRFSPDPYNRSSILRAP